MENSTVKNFDLVGVQAIYSKGELIYQYNKTDTDTTVDRIDEEKQDGVS